MSATCAAYQHTGQRACGSSNDVRYVLTGCVHEHLGSAWLCAQCRAAITLRGYCTACYQAGHICPVTLTQLPEPGLIASHISAGPPHSAARDQIRRTPPSQGGVT